jgi:hypothetical protein
VRYTARQALPAPERAANAQAIILAVTCHRLTRLRPSGPIAERDQESDGRPREEASICAHWDQIFEKSTVAHNR